MTRQKSQVKALPSLARKSICYYRHLLLCLSILSLGFCSDEIKAQILPDDSLQEERSIVTPNAEVKDSPADLIEGGAIRNSNLFHSFTEFNIGEGQQVYFASPEGIANIFSRITGGNPSEILGKLGVNGNANLFLLNPNGIIFGQNSSLDLSGSFLATTADSIVFPNDFAFSASNPDAPPLLTVNVPIGLQFGNQAESIVNRSQTKMPLNIDGTISEIIVGLRLSKENTLALIGGEVLIEGGAISLPLGRLELGAVGKNSFVSLQSIERGWSLGYQGVRNFHDIKMSENGFPSNIDIVDYDFNNVSKTGGDIRIQGKNIIFVDGSQINATNNVNTSGGLVIINAIESVQIIGSSTPIDLPDGSTLSLSSHISFGTTNNGRGGNIEIHTKKLVLQDRGSILVNALRLILNDVNQPIGEGQAGTITINASESTELVGETTTISSSTSTKGDAGNIEINTDRLIVRDGATIQANTSPKSEEFPESEGDGGSIIVNAREIDLLDGGSLIVNSQATGRGGDIEIDTEVLNLNNQGKITADSFGNDGGNISLNVSNILELRQQSTISTNAGETIGGGDGGNIDIDARFIFAVPEENSDISANAFEGNGGNITIDSESLFGIAYRNEDTPLSDITAFSRNKFALDGTVTINSPDVDPSQYLNETAVETKVPQLLRGCQAGRDSDSRFVNIGKGGLPIDPYDLVSSRELVEDLRLPQHWSQSIESNSNNQEIIEATGIQRDDRGDTILVGKDSDRITCGQ